MIANKIAGKITRVSKALPQKNSVTNEEEILRERYISVVERQQIIDDVRYNNGIFKNNKLIRLYNKSSIWI